ncbi:hypothetical protein HPB52_024340 [Rhipicephalus sanguineus]|uniref:Uncharacterized protein n=1 Tax=Rhipicephalus sanguineus TaxID=34632 RepID=A0A9D4TCI6_RHISA|nr:hypothetical protein HPB52_024340 [Rhipicephalus sanguineus]
MQQEPVRDRPVKKKKIRAWTEAARIVLELHPQTPMSHKEIFSEICTRGLKDASSPAALACLNAMLHAHSRGPEALFYRVFGAASVFGLKTDIPGSAVSLEADEDSGPETEDASVVNCVRDHKKAKVLYVKLPAGFRTPKGLSMDIMANGESLPNQQPIPNGICSSVPLDREPLRHSVRQQRRPVCYTDDSIERRTLASAVQASRSSARVAAKCNAQLVANDRPQTTREILASLPGVKPHKRSSRKLSMTAQIAETRRGLVDLETPDSILVNTNIKDLLTRHTMASLPTSYQCRLASLLPAVDCWQDAGTVRLSSSALSNEFFARACQEWRERLADGELTHESQVRLRAEQDRASLDPWKGRHFEHVWGHRAANVGSLSCARSCPRESRTGTLCMGTELKVDLLGAIQMMTGAWQDVKTDTVANRFRKAGFVTAELAETSEDFDDERTDDAFRELSSLIMAAVPPEVEADCNVQAVASLADENIVAAVAGTQDAQADSSSGDEDCPDEAAATRAYSAAEVAAAFGLIRRCCGDKEGTGLSHLDSLDKIEASVFNFISKTKKQAKISDFLSRK